MNGLSWAEAALNTLDLWLDSQNPRIDVSENASQEEIRLQLLKNEEIIELASEIVQAKRLLPGDRIITCIEDGKHVVLEGNRRVCACQMLLDPTLIPPEYQKRFPKADSEELILNISYIKADIAPNRREAETILTKRHTEPGIKRWSPIAKMRRVVRWFNKGMSIDEIAYRLGASKNNVRRSIREYNLLKYAHNLPGWTDEELEILKGEKLAVNPYTRFFTLSRTKELLKLEFDDKERPISSLPPEIFSILMRCIVRAFLLPDPSTGKPWANTRTKPDKIIKKCCEFHGIDLDKLEDTVNIAQQSPENNILKEETHDVIDEIVDNMPKEAQESAKTEIVQNKYPKRKRFFEELTCLASDQRLIQLVNEIKMINHIRMPIAATMLLRALLESSLRYHLVRVGKWDELCRTSKRDPGLQQIILYCVNKNNNVFKNQRAREVLNAFSGSGFKEVFDLVVHGTWADANYLTLEQASSLLRPLITYILNDERWGG
ncbi:hypothetical protein G7K71_08025 [Desulfofundulus sp. TPOSR]|uniref:hypothetical protein n=1 Tax=Desulfofundulus sp. TPOSR TaxID=2714340 RepID=UPI00140CF24F|nr:hypothetical protein [Desulfofundulus sp. TPOSR]NHM26930.1 hypothetical protein [Desulfofundulus sp. TPOSR]